MRRTYKIYKYENFKYEDRLSWKYVQLISVQPSGLPETSGKGSINCLTELILTSESGSFTDRSILA